MRSISLQHKKGVSELISYTLLIILAVSASILVYNYLKVLVPKDKPTCPDGSSLILTSYSCNSSAMGASLNLTLSNKGRFTVDGAYIRIGKLNDSARKQVNKDQEFFAFEKEIGLKPGIERSYSYNFSNSIIADTTPTGKDFILELQPAMIDDNTRKLAACKSFTQTITCY